MAGMLPSQRYDLGKTIGSTSDATKKLVDGDLIFIDDASEYNDAQKVRIAQAGDLIKDCLPVGLAGEQIIDLTSNGIYYQLKFVNGFLVKMLEGTAGINLGSQLGYFYADYGEASEAQYYIVYAFGLTNDLIITAPLNWELSLTQNGTYTDSLNIAPVNGIIPMTQIWVRIKDTAPQGEFSSNIINSSIGVDNVLTPINGEVARYLLFDDDIPIIFDNDNYIDIFGQEAVIPEFLPDGGSYDDEVDVTVSSQSVWSKIIYTEDGSEPSEEE